MFPCSSGRLKYDQGFYTFLRRQCSNWQQMDCWFSII